MSTLDTRIPKIVGERTAVSAFTTQNRPTRPSGLAASLTLAWRALLKLKHVPSQLVDATLYPILITLMMTYIFGGSLAGSVGAYVQQLIPGVLVLSIAMISSYTALGLNRDIDNGIFDRFRSLSFWRPAVLVGALLGDTVRYLMTAVIIITLGFILGFRPTAGISGILSSLGLLMLFAFSLSWVWTALGLLMENPESVMVISGLATFPLTFTSNVFVDPATMPDLLQRFAMINPVSLLTTAIRGLMHGAVTTAQIAHVFLSCALLIVLFAPLTMYLYNHKNTG